MIRDINKKKRLGWAREHLGDLFDDMIFTDETSIQMETHGCFCCRKQGQAPRLKPKPKHPTKVHVWAGISKRGRTGVCIFDGIMKSCTQKSLARVLFHFCKRHFVTSINSCRTTRNMSRVPTKVRKLFLVLFKLMDREPAIKIFFVFCACLI